MTTHHPERQNLILASLSKADYAHLAPELQQVMLERRTMLNEAGATLQHVYFPRTALVSLVGLTADGHATEVGMVGAEGFCGVPVVLGSRIQRFEATVQVSGSLEKVAVHVLEEKSGKTPLSDVLRRLSRNVRRRIVASDMPRRFSGR